MKSIPEMKIIQIDITNACVHRCSNCTRFCGHHKRPFFMDFETFKNAVDSLEEFPGMIGIIGGEPTLHPEFERFCEYLREVRVGNNIQVIREPIEDMQKYIRANLTKIDKRAGLWSSLNDSYYKNIEAINDTFATQFLNDHDNACLHQALLMPRKELGISDEEWEEKRNNCWIQNTWSATITPKGAFFCEVAGSLDMLFNGKGGWKVEKGWWKRTKDEFGDQLNWCELCSACIDVPQRLSNDERDDITPEIYKRLIDLGSPKAKSGMCIVHNPYEYNKENYKTFTGKNDYMEAGGNIRTSSNNRHIYPREFCVGNRSCVKEILAGKPSDWIIIGDDKDEVDLAKFYFSNVILNIGCFYCFGNTGIFNINASALRGKITKIQDFDDIWKLYSLDKIVKVSKNKAKKKPVEFKILDTIPSGSRVVLYGAGKVGTDLFIKVMRDKSLKIQGWIDKNFLEKGFPVCDISILNKKEYDFIVVGIKQKDIFEEIKKELVAVGVNVESIIWCPRYEDEV